MFISHKRSNSRIKSTLLVLSLSNIVGVFPLSRPPGLAAIPACTPGGGGGPCGG